MMELDELILLFSEDGGHGGLACTLRNCGDCARAKLLSSRRIHFSPFSDG